MTRSDVALALLAQQLPLLLARHRTYWEATRAAFALADDFLLQRALGEGDDDGGSPLAVPIKTDADTCQAPFTKHAWSDDRTVCRRCGAVRVMSRQARYEQRRREHMVDPKHRQDVIDAISAGAHPKERTQLGLVAMVQKARILHNELVKAVKSGDKAKIDLAVKNNGEALDDVEASHPDIVGHMHHTAGDGTEA